MRRLLPPYASWVGHFVQALPAIGICEELAYGSAIEPSVVQSALASGEAIWEGSVPPWVSNLNEAVLDMSRELHAPPHDREGPSPELVFRVEHSLPDRLQAVAPRWQRLAGQRDLQTLGDLADESRSAFLDRPVEAGPSGPFAELWPFSLGEREEIEKAVLAAGHQPDDVRQLLSGPGPMQAWERSVPASALTIFVPTREAAERLAAGLAALMDRNGPTVWPIVAFGPGIEPRDVGRLVELGVDCFPPPTFGERPPGSDEELRYHVMHRQATDRVGWEMVAGGWVRGDVRQTWATRGRRVDFEAVHAQGDGAHADVGSVARSLSAEDTKAIYDHIVSNFQGPRRVKPLDPQLALRTSI